MNAKYWTPAAALLAAAATPIARADDDLSKRVAACTREQDDARRLACFDRAAAPAADQTAAEQPTAGKVDPAQGFGVHGSELARTREADDPKQDTTPKRRATAVTRVR